MGWKKKKSKKKIKIVLMKMVRINDKTEIEVDASIPDEVAKEEYLEKLIGSKPFKQKGFGKRK